MKNSMWTVAAPALIVLLALTGCGNGEQSDESAQHEGPVELTVWGWDSSFNGYAMEQAAALDDDVTVNFVEMGKAAALQKLHTVLASGATADLPDIVIISDLNAQGYLMSYPGAFLPMEDAISYDDFASYKIDSVSYDGVGYGIPFDSGVAGLFYRTDYMAEIGMTAEDMENLTWDEYLALGPKLKEQGHYLETYNPDDISGFQIMLQSAGSWYTDDSGNADFLDNPALAECYRIFNTLNQSDFCKIVSDWGEFAGAINGGDVAAVIRGSWISSTIMAADEQAGKWAVAQVPRIDVPGATNYSNQGGSSWFVLANGPHAQEAKAFMAETFGGNVDLYNTLLEEKTIIGTYLPASDVPAYSEPSEFYGGQMVNGLLADWTSKIPRVNPGAFSAEAQASLTSVTPRLLGGENYEDLMQEATTQFNQKVQ